ALAGVVRARREPRQLDLLVGQTEAARRARCQLGYALRVASGVDVPGIDRASEARRGAEARGAIGAARQALELRELDHVRPVGAHAVLAVLLRPVEGAVSEPDQLVALRRVLRRDRDTCAHGYRTDLLEIERRDPLHDRRGRGQRGRFAVAREQECELIATEPERLAGLAEPCGELRENAIAGRVTEAVVDPLEIV